MDLSDIRKDIDEIDSQLVALLAKRMDCSKKVAEIKREKGLPIFHPQREKEIIEKVRDRGGRYGSYISEIYSLLMQCSKELQREENSWNGKVGSLVLGADKIFNPKGEIACYGEEGAFTSEAFNKAFSNEAIPVFSKSFEGVFKAVSEGSTALGFVPVENSSAGSVDEVYDLLLRYKLYIVFGAAMPVTHNLLGVKGAKPKDIKTVFSHRQALNQCGSFLRERGIEAREFDNTAAAAKYVASLGDKSVAAIGSKDCGQRAGLALLERGIQSFENNKTRFIVLSKAPVIVENSNKISVVFSLDNTPGSLQKILTRFSFHGLNLTKLESRPGKNGDFETQFYLDFLGSVESEKTLSLLSEMESELSDFSFLGNYKEINL